MGDWIHSYGPVILGILLSGIVAVGASFHNRLERIDARIHHKDYLEERFNNMEWRIEQLEQTRRKE